MDPGLTQKTGSRLCTSNEQIFKFFGKRADDVPLPDAGKKLEDLKGFGKSDEILNEAI